jgi:hypothetical protein
MKQKIALKEKKLEKTNGKFYNVLMIIKKKVSLQQFLPLSETEIQGLLQPTQASLGYFLAWFQSLQLPSTIPVTGRGGP